MVSVRYENNPTRPPKRVTFETKWKTLKVEESQVLRERFAEDPDEVVTAMKENLLGVFKLEDADSNIINIDRRTGDEASDELDELIDTMMDNPEYRPALASSFIESMTGIKLAVQKN